MISPAVEPFYRDELITLYQGDCREVAVAEWTAADVLITDPPYGTQMIATGKSAHKGGYGRRTKYDQGDGLAATIANDETTEARDQMLELWGPDKPALLFGSPRLADPPGEWADRLVWDKRRPGINGGPWRYRHESIYVRAGFLRVNDSAVSIIEAHPDKEYQARHIHAKPMKLMLALVEAAPPGLIVDTFCGSGATLAACRILGRPAIGIELDPAHCATAVERLKRLTSPAGLEDEAGLFEVLA